MLAVNLAAEPDGLPETAPEPLAGFTVAVTASRRREELAALLQRRGARVLCAPALRIVPLADDAELLEATRRCLAAPVDLTVATTGIGFRGWMEAADGWGLGEALVQHLARSTPLARGPKARGAVRAAGLPDAWSPASESSAEVLDHLLSRDLDGRRVAVQLHGEPLPDFTRALREAGAEVVEVPVYRWVPPEDVTPLARLVDAVLSRSVDAVTFTSAPAAVSLIRTAEEAGRLPGVLEALRSDVVAACVGPVTAGPLDRLGVPTLQPARARLGSLVRTVAEALPARSRALPVCGSRLELRGHAVVLDGRLVPVPPVPLAVLRALVHPPGRVRTRTELLQVLPGSGNDEHAVEMAVTRLRSALGSARLVQTVVKRGYRLAYEPEAVACPEPDLP